MNDMNRSNILFLFSDEHSFRCMGHVAEEDGGEPVFTPAFDRLAEQSTVFTDAYCQMPLCTPSRIALLTGLDVLWPDRLPADHPARTWPNVIFSAHEIGKVKSHPGAAQPLDKFHRVCLENIGRHIRREPLQFLMDEQRYDRST